MGPTGPRKHAQVGSRNDHEGQNDWKEVHEGELQVIWVFDPETKLGPLSENRLPMGTLKPQAES